jgi:carboxyl-terminal processing protease
LGWNDVNPPLFENIKLGHDGMKRDETWSTRLGYLFSGAGLGAVLTLGSLWLAGYPIGINLSQPGFQKLFSTYHLLSTKYYQQIPENKLLDGAVSGMVQSLNDPFSDYFSPDDAKQFQSALSSTMVGIGVEVASQGKAFVVHTVFPGTPAEKAGLTAGDALIAVNGKPIAGMTFDKVRQLIVGPKGSYVTLTIQHAGTDKKNTDVKVQREEVTIPTVYTKMLEQHVGYMDLTVVGAKTGSEVKKAYASLQKEGAKALVIDLRDNPGGYLDQAIQIANVLIPAGDKILSTVDRAGTTTVYKSNGPGTHLPIVVLMNGNTASAAEVLASALHDDVHAPLVGEKSFGKGTVQETADYADGSELKYTVAKWLTADGKWIHHIGIQPTSVVPLPKTNGKAAADAKIVDVQLGKATQLAISAEK